MMSISISPSKLTEDFCFWDSVLVSASIYGAGCSDFSVVVGTLTNPPNVFNKRSEKEGD